MRIARLTIDLHLPGCGSLKDKRRRLSKLRDKFGHKTHISVCESDHADTLQRAQWSFVAAAGAAQVVEQALTEIEQYVALNVDAQILSVQRQWLE